LHQVGKLTHN